MGIVLKVKEIYDGMNSVIEMGIIYLEIVIKIDND